MSPAEPYCRACGAPAHRGGMIELERLDTAPTPRALPEPASATTMATSPPKRPRTRRGLAIGLAAAALVAAITAAAVLSGDDERQGAPSASTAAPTAPPPDTTPSTVEPPPTSVASYTQQQLYEQVAVGLVPIPVPPLAEQLPVTLVVVDDGGTAHLLDMATGLTNTRSLAIGPLDGAHVTEVLGGNTGPVALRASMSRYHLIDIDDPVPRWIEGRTIAAHDDVTGWYWLGTCFVAPCERFSRLTGYGPTERDRKDVELPTPTERVIATEGKLYVEAAGSVTSSIR